MGIWSQASSLAAQTPEERNRYVDFLRSVSILMVITGHWLIATAIYVDGNLAQGHLLQSEPRRSGLPGYFRSCRSSLSSAATQTRSRWKAHGASKLLTRAGWRARCTDW